MEFFFSMLCSGSILKADGLCKYPVVRSTCEELLAGHIHSPYLLSLLVDIYCQLGDKELLEKAVQVRDPLLLSSFTHLYDF